MNPIERFLKTKEAKNTGSIKTYTTDKACYIASLYYPNAAFMFGCAFWINGIRIVFN